jgi:lipopolysaccharide heptosyltransferase I
MTTRPERPQRILIVRPSALGDVARTVPALVSLVHKFPGAQIDWLVRDSFAEVIAAHPALHEAVHFPRQRFRRFGTNLRVTADVFRYMRMLKQRRYDIVYDLQGLGRSGWLTWTTRSPHRVGPAEAREMAWLAYTQRISTAHATHTVDAMLAVLEGDGVPAERDMRLYVADKDRSWADLFLMEHRLTPGKYAVLAPTARWLSKRWPIERFAEIARRLPSLGLEGIVVVGSRGEESQTAPLASLVTPGGDLTGKTSVGQLMAILERCGLLIANDSAALHIATGFGRRSVSLFGPTDPRKVGPYRYDTGVVTAPTTGGQNYRDVNDQSIIASIDVERVWDAAQRVMQAPPPLTIHS